MMRSRSTELVGRVARMTDVKGMQSFGWKT